MNWLAERAVVETAHDGLATAAAAAADTAAATAAALLSELVGRSRARHRRCLDSPGVVWQRAGGVGRPRGAGALVGRRSVGRHADQGRGAEEFVPTDHNV